VIQNVFSRMTCTQQLGFGRDNKQPQARAPSAAGMKKLRPKEEQSGYVLHQQSPNR